MLRSLENQVGRIRERLVNAIKGKPQQADRVRIAIEDGLEQLLLEHAEKAAERVGAQWRTSREGQALLAVGETDLSRASREFRRRAEQTVREWQDAVLESVRSEGSDKRTSARYMAFGPNGLAIALMVLAFAPDDAGATTAGAAGAGSSAELGRRLLEAVFGPQAVSSLVHRARADLTRRTSAVLAGEQRRHEEVIDALAVDPEAAGRLRDAARRVTDERFAQQQRDPGGHSA